MTEARPGLSQDISYRERRYLIMMGIRTICFIAAVLMFVNRLGWLTAIPVVGAIVIPYFAVIFANGGREPNGQPDIPAIRAKLTGNLPAADAACRPPGAPRASGGTAFRTVAAILSSDASSARRGISPDQSVKSFPNAAKRS